MEKIVQKKLKKCYISGPMTGIEDENRKEFEEAKKRLDYFGFDSINPHTIHSKELIDDIDKRFKAGVLSEDERWALFLKKDIEVLMRCEFIVVLKGWENSRGARLEVFNALSVNMPMFSAHTLAEFTKEEAFNLMRSAVGNEVVFL